MCSFLFVLFFLNKQRGRGETSDGNLKQAVCFLYFLSNFFIVIT